MIRLFLMLVSLLLFFGRGECLLTPEGPKTTEKVLVASSTPKTSYLLVPVEKEDINSTDISENLISDEDPESAKKLIDEEDDKEASDKIEERNSDDEVKVENVLAVNSSKSDGNNFSELRNSSEILDDERKSSDIEMSNNFKRNVNRMSYKSKEDSEKMVVAMTESLSKILNINGGKSLGKEERSGPSSDPFGPVDDLPPVVFPHPATSGRENYLSLPSLDRERVTTHFREKSGHSSENIEKELSIKNNLLHSERPSLTIRQRTPKPERKPMLMILTPQPLGKDGKRLVTHSPQQHFHPHQHFIPHETSGISIGVKGDHGQIKRILTDEEKRKQLQESSLHHFDIVTPRSHGQGHSLHPLRHGLDPLFFQQNILFDHHGNPPHRRFSDFGATPAPPYGFPVTISSNNPGTIFHGPNLPGHSIFNAVDSVSNSERRPLTSEHFIGQNNHHSGGSSLQPREPHSKVPFGFAVEDYEYEDYISDNHKNTNQIHHNLDHHQDHHHEEYHHEYHDKHHEDHSPQIITQIAADNYRPSSHGVPGHSLFINKGDTPSLLRPFLPIEDRAYPPASVAHFSPSPKPTHFVTTAAPFVFHKTTPRPNFEIQAASVTPRPLLGSNLRPVHPPSIKPPGTEGFYVTTFRPSGAGSYLPVTPSVFVTTAKPQTLHHVSHHDRGPNKFSAPSHFLSHLNPGNDYSTQYQSGEHLILNKPPKHPLDDSSSEYSYHYAVHSPSTGDIKSAHETRLPYGTVVGGYSLLQPDGVTRQVSYKADKFSGFQANVEYLTPDGSVIPPPGK